MKIIHYLFGLPPVRVGGEPRYVLDLAKKQLNMGHNVCLLVPGPIKSEKDNVYVKKWKQYSGIKCYRVVNSQYIANGTGICNPSLFMRKSEVTIYEQWFKKVQPDVVHLHSLMGLDLEFLLAAKKEKIPVIFTTHDFFGLCPKTDLLYNGKACEETDWLRCYKCCENAISVRRMQLEQSDIYRFYCRHQWLMKMTHEIVQVKKKLKNEKKIDGGEKNIASKDERKKYIELQKYYRRMFDMIDYFLFNSRQTKEIYEDRLGKMNGKVIPVFNAAIEDNRKEKKFDRCLKLGFLGNQTPHKGYAFLIETLEMLRKTGRTDFILYTYMLQNDEKKAYICNQRPFNPNEEEKVFDEIDLLIVPSLCKETFGMVMMEAFCNGVPSLISENVGAKMILEDYPDTGKVYKNSEELLLQLTNIYDHRDILKKMNQNILKSDIDLNYERYVNEIIDIYANVLDLSDN